MPDLRARIPKPAGRRDEWAFTHDRRCGPG
jgi:hypothetical protein